MNKWWWLLLVILLWAGVGLAIFDFQRGRSGAGVGLPVQADRIVSAAPSLTEILFALGLEEKIVAVSNNSDYPPQAAEKKKVGTFWQPNIEAVIAAKPDLVITLGFKQQRDLAERLKRIGYNSLTLNIEKISELFEAIERIGAATGRQCEADELNHNITKKLSDLSSLVGREKKVRVLWVVQREPLRVAGRDTFVNEMIELAGGENAIGPTVHKYPPIGAEQVIASGADVIIEPAMGQEDLAGQKETLLKYWSKFKNVPAVKKERVYVIRGDTVSRLGPRLFEGTESIARCLRPDLFAK
jgi:iron complex transport system substrate-binding protein